MALQVTSSLLTSTSGGTRKEATPSGKKWRRLWLPAHRSRAAIWCKQTLLLNRGLNQSCLPRIWTWPSQTRFSSKFIRNHREICCKPPILSRKTFRCLITRRLWGIRRPQGARQARIHLSCLALTRPSTSGFTKRAHPSTSSVGSVYRLTTGSPNRKPSFNYPPKHPKVNHWSPKWSWSSSPATQRWHQSIRTLWSLSLWKLTRTRS